MSFRERAMSRVVEPAALRLLQWRGDPVARLMLPATKADPYPLYAQLRRTPVSLQADGTYVISTYRETAQLLRDPRISHEQRNLAKEIVL